MSDISSLEYIYIIRLYQFIERNINIFKIGRSRQKNCIRVRAYPKGSELYYMNTCFDCIKCEREIIKLFSTKYIIRKDNGSEFFEGNIIEMKNDIHKINKITVRFMINPFLPL